MSARLPRLGDRHFLANFRGHKEWRGCRESRELDRDAGPARDGCVGRRRVHDKSNGAERGGVHGNDVTRVSAPRDLAEHWIGGDERRVSVDRRPARRPRHGGTSGTRCRQRNRRAKILSLPAMC